MANLILLVSYQHVFPTCRIWLPWSPHDLSHDCRLCISLYQQFHHHLEAFQPKDGQWPMHPDTFGIPRLFFFLALHGVATGASEVTSIISTTSDPSEEMAGSGRPPGQISFTAALARGGVIHELVLTLLPDEDASASRANLAHLRAGGNSNGPGSLPFLEDTK